MFKGLVFTKNADERWLPLSITWQEHAKLLSVADYVYCFFAANRGSWWGIVHAMAHASWRVVPAGTLLHSAVTAVSKGSNSLSDRNSSSGLLPPMFF